MDESNDKVNNALDPANFPQSLTSPTTLISLTYEPLNSQECINFVRSPSCGANVLFLGTTRDTFDSKVVTRLSYSAYPALALRSLQKIAREVLEKYQGRVEKICIIHRLGDVAIAEESIAVAISAGHRGPGWQAAEEVLERVKQRAEIWKQEWFAKPSEDGEQTETSTWKANQETDREGQQVTR